MDDIRIRQLIDELDRIVKKDGARIILNQYGGGPDESEIKGNTNGYLRFGIELMKCAFVEPEDKTNPNAIKVDFRGLVSERSNIEFDYFYRYNELVEEAFPTVTLGSRIFMYVVIGIALMALGFMLIGFITVVRVLF